MNVSTTRLERLCTFHGHQGGTIYDFNRHYDADFLNMTEEQFENHFRFTQGVDRISDFLKTIRDADDWYELECTLMDIGCNMIQAERLLSGFKCALKFSSELRIWIKRTLVANRI